MLVGECGSGKSAVLVGIQLGLGGGRGAASTVVMHGRESALVRITLYNEGDDAFEQKRYSDLIVVERIITASTGSSSYKIMNGRTKKTISTKKADLNLVTNYFDIQVDNPMVMCQENYANPGISLTDSKAMYANFMKATQMDKMSLELETLHEELETMKARIADQKSSASVLEQDYEKAEKKYKDLQKLRKFEGKRDHLVKEAVWASVREREEDAAAEYVRARDTWERAYRDIKSSEDSAKAKDCALAARGHSLNDFKKFVGRSVKREFVDALYHRNYTGKLTFKHDAQSVRFTVNPREVDRKILKQAGGTLTGAGGVNMLSAGERSFTAASFIVSLWPEMESPFRAFDGVDSFMDPVNRQIAISMMIDAARRKKDKQFIVILRSPLPNFIEGQDIRVTELAGQTALCRCDGGGAAAASCSCGGGGSSSGGSGVERPNKAQRTGNEGAAGPGGGGHMTGTGTLRAPANSDGTADIQLRADLAASTARETALAAKLAASVARETVLKDQLEKLTSVTVFNVEIGEDEKQTIPADVAIQSQKQRREKAPQAAAAAAAARAEASNFVKTIKLERDDAKDNARAAAESVEDTQDNYQYMITHSERQKQAIVKLKELAAESGANAAEIEAAAKVY